MGSAVVLSLGEFNFVSRLGEDDFESIKPICKKRSFKPGEKFFVEGQRSDCMYLLRSGKASISKKSFSITDAFYGKIESKHDIQFRAFYPGSLVGESSYVDGHKRGHTVTAEEDCEVYEISYHDLRDFTQKSMERMQAIKEELIVSISSHFRVSNNIIVKKLTYQSLISKKRMFIASYFVNVLICALLYILVLSLSAHLVTFHDYVKITSAPLFFLFLAIISITKHKPPLKAYGITFENAKKSIVESMIFTLLFCIAITFAKWAVLRYTHWFPSGVHLFEHEKSAVGLYYIFLIIVYLVFSPIQEFLARGALQAPLETILTGKYKVFYAILLSNLLFSALHLHLAPAFAIATFVPGLFWGWLFYRSRNLIGVSISHFIVGVYAIKVLHVMQIL